MIEALVVGRVGVDLTPTRARTSLAAADAFSRAVGGFAGNIGTGIARLGVPTAVISAVGDDGHGEHVRAALGAEGIDVAGLRTMPSARTQVAFFEAWPPDRFPVTFYRLPPAPDALLAVADLAGDAFTTARLVVVSAALLAVEPSRAALLAALQRRAAADDRRADRRTAPAADDRSAPAADDATEPKWTVLDLDWRPTLWPDPAESPELVARAIAGCDVVIGSDEEFAAARLRPEAVVDMASGRSRLVVVKHGPGGASLISGAGRHNVAGIAVDVVCGLGAGDALTAAFGAGLLAGLNPSVALERGNAAGAIVASRLMCSSAMPVAAEIDAMIDRSATAAREAHA